MTAAFKVPLEPIESSNLAAIGYDEQRSILAVQFKHGPIFHYAGVPSDVAALFAVSASKGRFYAQTIRGKFSGQLMTGECEKCGILGYVGETCSDCGCGVHVAKPYTPKPAKALHWVDYDAPRIRMRPAACGLQVSQKEYTVDAAAVTCPDCRAWLERTEAMRY